MEYGGLRTGVSLRECLRMIFPMERADLLMKMMKIIKGYMVGGKKVFLLKESKSEIEIEVKLSKLSTRLSFFHCHIVFALSVSIGLVS